MATIRTVSTHGAPTEADVPVVEWSHAYIGQITSVSGKDRTYWQPEDRWVPVSELLDLPPTPLPPVTITIPRDAAESYAQIEDYEGTALTRVFAAACREALEGDR